MRVLVTGASGFLGRGVTAALASAGDHVVAAMREEAGAFPSGVEVVRHGDLATQIQWRTLLSGIDCVVHLAGIAQAGAGIPADAYDRINHRATAELAAAAQRARIKRLVFMSSVRAQSGPSAERPLRESDAPKPTDAYGASKLAAERAVLASGVPCTILRPTLVYGPGVKGNFAALARLAARPIPLPFARLHNRRSLLSRDGLVDAIAVVLKSPATAGETYLVADRAPISFRDMVAALRRGLGRRANLFPVPHRALQLALRAAGRPDALPQLAGDLVVDPAKLMAAGWSPPQDTAASLAALARQMA